MDEDKWDEILASIRPDLPQANWGDVATGNTLNDLTDAKRMMQGLTPLVPILPTQDGVYVITDAQKQEQAR